MVLKQVRGSVVDATTSAKWTWANTANAVDGTYGTNNATYCTATSNARNATDYIEIGGFDGAGKFGDIPAGSTINSVTVYVRRYVNTTSGMDYSNVEPFDGAATIGTVQTMPLVTTVGTYSYAGWSLTLAQLQSVDFKIRIEVDKANNTTSNVFYLDYVDIQVDYTESAKQGSASGSFSFAGSASGITDYVGSASGAFAYAGSALGTAASAPTAAFTPDKTSIKVGEYVKFTDTSTDDPTSWLWDFDDGVVANQMSLATATFEDGTGIVQNGEFCTWARSTASARTGTASLLMTQNSGAGGYYDVYMNVTSWCNARVGETVTFVAYVKAASATSTNAYFGFLASNGNTFGASVAINTTTWTKITLTLVVPSGMTFVYLAPIIQDSSGSGSAYIDDVGMWMGSNVDWEPPGHSANLLSANQASIETDTTGFTSYNCSLSRSAAYSAYGDYSLAAAGSGTDIQITTLGSTSGVPVAPGESIVGYVEVLTTDTRNVAVNLRWYDSGGAYLSLSNGPYPEVAPGAFTKLIVQATAPASAAYVDIQIYSGPDLTGETIYADKFGIWRGVSQVWSMPLESPGRNLLSYSMASGSEDGVTSGLYLSGCTVTSSTDITPAQGKRTYKLTSTGTIHLRLSNLEGTNGIPVVPGKRYSIYGKSYQPASTTGVHYFIAVCYWYQSNGSPSAISTYTASPSNFATAESWVPLTDGNFNHFIPPADAAYARVEFSIQSNMYAGAVFYLDELGFWEENHRIWELPGDVHDSQHPLVQFNTPGTYNVTLKATNANGSDISTSTAITVGSSANLGSASGSTSFVGSASGSRTPEGSGSDTFTYSGSASGSFTAEGSSAGSTTYVGSASGSFTAEGSSTGSTTFVGSASGSFTAEGSSTGSTTYVGSASGSFTAEGSSTGSTTYVGSASGVAPAVGVNEGSASGTFAYSGSASGSFTAEGSSTGSTTFVGSASGSFTAEGSSTGSTTFVGSASGFAPIVGANEGSSAGSTTYVGSASGSFTAEGSSTGSTTYVGSASGSFTAEGSSTGSTTYVGSASGSFTAEGSSTGSTTYVGSASGSKSSVGSASGSFNFVGAAYSGQIKYGSATGSTVYSGSAAGARTSYGSSSGTTTYSGAAVGGNAATGLATGSTTYSGTASGEFQAKGFAVGTTNHVGAASGTKSPVGTASGSTVYLGQALGGLVSAGSASGSFIFESYATGSKPSKGTTSGSTEHSSFASGERESVGYSTGLTAYSGTASGIGNYSGSAEGLFDYVGIAIGASSKPHNATTTGTLLPRRWDGELLPRRWEAELQPRRWEGTIL